MTAPNQGQRRINTDVLRLIETKHPVTLLDGFSSFYVKFYGPKDTPYEGGVFRIEVNLNEKYPFEPPKIAFKTKIHHPNICEKSGLICLNVLLGYGWTPLFDLINIFDIFIPQLLTYPNSAWIDQCPERQKEFKQKVVEFVREYATEEAFQAQEKAKSEADDEDSSMSELSEDETNE